MTIQEKSYTPGDRLALATDALRAVPIANGPSTDVLARVERIPETQRRLRFSKSPLKLIAATVGVLLVSAIAVLIVRHSENFAFGDVVQAIQQTHTFTAVVDAGDFVPSGTGSRIRLSVKGMSLRLDGEDSISIFNQSAGTAVQLVPSKHQATVTLPIVARQFDLYGILRDYHTGKEKPLGERKIAGRMAQGFKTVSDAIPGQDVILWVDRETKLPLEVEIGPVVLTDLRFDVPLEDSLFDTKLPAGYSTASSTDTAANDRLHYAGRVVDERGKPIAGVAIAVSVCIDTLRPGSWIPSDEQRKTDQDGRFNFDEGGHKLLNNPVRIEFKHPDFLYGDLQDVRLLPAKEALDLHVTLRDGSRVAGRVVDVTGHALGGATVEAVYGKIPSGRTGNSETRWAYSKKVVADFEGKFELRGLATAPVVIQVCKIEQVAVPVWGQGKLDLRSTTQPSTVEVAARPLDVSGKPIHTLFGMKLVDVDDDLRDRLSLDPIDRVLVLDAGLNSDRLGIGHLEPGDSFWMANEAHIANFDELAKQLLATCEAQEQRGRSVFVVRVVYDYSRPNDEGSNTQYLQLNADDLTELRKIVKR